MTAADRNTTADALEAMADKDVSDYDVMQLGRIQPEPYRTQMLSLARNMSEARPLMRRAARLLRTPDTPTDSGPTVEIGGQVMTQAQFDAARFPLLNSAPPVGLHVDTERNPVGLTFTSDIDTPTDSDTAARARALLDGPKPTTHAGWQQYEDELIAAAPTLIADLLAEVDRLTRWKAEGTEVIESWERVYDALGDVGVLGQRRSDAVLAEVLRLVRVNREQYAANVALLDRRREAVEAVGKAEAERDAAVARADALEAAIRAHRDAVKCCDECAAAQVTDPHPNDHDGPLWAAAERGTDRQRDDDRHPLTRFMKARSNEWGTDR